MDQDLIEKIKALTGRTDADEATIEDALTSLSLDQMYALIDAKRKGDDKAMLNLITPVLPVTAPTENKPAEVEEATMSDKNKDKNKMRIGASKPRDPMARELEKGIYQPKVTPNRKEILDRRDRKHKGKYDESMVEESIAFSSIPSIKKMLSLAGRPAEDEDVMKAMEDFMGDFSDTGGLRISDIAVPTGTAIQPGTVSFGQEEEPEDEFDAELDAIGAKDEQMAVGGGSCTAAYLAIRAAVEAVKTNMVDIKVGEFADVKCLINELNSAIDQLGNSVKGQ